jgi:tRNA (mo5U34)-methyltransferase
MITTQEEIKALEPWFHNIHLPDGNQTAPDHFLGDFPLFKWNKIKESIPEDLTGWRVLDIGCNAGFYSIEFAKRGAEVLAIDVDVHYLKQAKWTAEKFNVSHRITFRHMQVYDLIKVEETFDLVWFMGVFYHLRYPVLAMDIVAQKAKNMLVFQTLSVPGNEEMNIPEDIGFHDREIMKSPAFPYMAFIENRLAGDPTNWWVPNHQCILSLIKNCGFRLQGIPEDETYIFFKDNEIVPDFTSWNHSEFLSATGREWQEEINIKIKK